MKFDLPDFSFNTAAKVPFSISAAFKDSSEKERVREASAEKS
jgi:hypothetical protein